MIVKMDFMTLVITNVISTVFLVIAGISTYKIQNRIKKKQDLEEESLARQQAYFADIVQRINSLENALQASIKSRLYQSMIYFIEKGSISAYEKQNLESMYDFYIETGGNGIIKHLWKEFEEVKIYEQRKQVESE